MKLHLNRQEFGFEDAFLLGNGWMGQTLSFAEDGVRIGLSHITFFSGKPEPITQHGQAEAYRRLCDAVDRGDWDRAEAAAEDFKGEKGNYGTALPAGSLDIRFSGDAPAEIRRSLDLRTGVAECEYNIAGRVRSLTSFCSHPDRVFCLHVTDPEGTELSLSLRDMDLCVFEGRDLKFEKQALETRHSDGTCGVRLRGLVRVIGGKTVPEGEALRATGLREGMILLALETDYDDPDFENAFPRLRVLLDRAESFGFESLRIRHTRDFASGIDRVSLSLPSDPDAERLFALGRYLLRGAAREDSPCAMSLQGLWNDDVACRIGWTCDMHLDINTQMNTWLCGPGRLEESREGLLRWMEERLIPEGEKAAGIFYGFHGWSAELVSNLWGYAQPYWHRSLSPCPGCGAWTAEDFAERARFSGTDADADRAAKALEGAVRFFLDKCRIDENGRVHFGASITPENAFMEEGKKRYAFSDVPFEGAVIRRLFRSYIETAGPNDDLSRKASEMLEAFDPITMDEDGLISEFAPGLLPHDLQHRHLSHLMPLYPFDEIDPDRTPGLAAAAEKTIRARLTPYEKWEDTGWSRSMMALYAARLRQGDEALFHLQEMQKNLQAPNGLIMHPSTRGAASFQPVWELDGNTGAAMGIAEMLLQSHAGYVYILPALPGAWREGSFTGLGARYGLAIDCAWRKGKPYEAAVRNLTARCQNVRVRIGEKLLSLTLAPGEKKKIECIGG